MAEPHSPAKGRVFFGLWGMRGKWAESEYGRRAPLEEGRDGLMEVHAAVSILARKRRSLQKWIDDPDPVDFLAMLQVFG